MSDDGDVPAWVGEVAVWDTEAPIWLEMVGRGHGMSIASVRAMVARVSNRQADSREDP